jgi:hypothetical protein
MASSALYDLIGSHYTATRSEDLRIARVIDRALGDARSVLNVGAGTGSYEPTDREVVAVEPSTVMIAQRPADAAPAAYLDRRVRDGISVFSRLGESEIDGALARLHDDLESGAWNARHSELLELEELDLGYCVVIAEFPPEGQG